MFPEVFFANPTISETGKKNHHERGVRIYSLDEPSYNVMLSNRGITFVLKNVSRI